MFLDASGSRRLRCSPDQRIWSLCDAAVRASAQKGSPQKALSDYRTLVNAGTLRPGRATLGLVLEACRGSGDLPIAAETHSRMIKTGMESREPLVGLLLRVHLDHGRLRDAHALFDAMPGWDSDPVPGNLVLAAYLRSGGGLAGAVRFFDGMRARDSVSWNSMIAGCVRRSRPAEAIGFFRGMLRSGVDPDAFSFSSALSACARAGALASGEWVHGLMLDGGVKMNHVLSSALVDMYAKCGKIELSRKAFDAAPRTDPSVWNAMISGLAINGLGTQSLEVFSAMQDEGVAPDAVTFVGILTACGHCALVDQGLHHFFAMKLRFSVEPRVEHYGAVVDLLARAGRLDEAHGTIKAMPMEPDAAAWRALLSACRTHGRPGLGEAAVEQMARLGSGDYVLLSGAYSSAEEWGRAESVRRAMKANGVRKRRGLSWVELGGGRVREFGAGDGSRRHPEPGGVHGVLDGLMRRVKAKGFVPAAGAVGMDLLEEEKEASLAWHSEKLAVSYAILRTAPGTEIRVSKNLRACSDCHSWLKVVSEVLSRRIIVRDRIRFHHFERGSCSCNDYW